MKLKNLSFYLAIVAVLLVACNDDGEKDNARFDYNFPQDCCQSDLRFDRLSDELDCKPSIDSITFIDHLSLYIPCVFSPDSDQLLNRTHNVFTNDFCTDICSVEIFAQDGTLVFSNGQYRTNNFSNGWDGTNDNEMVEGPFEIIYRLKCQDSDYEVQGVVCALLCSSSASYTDQNLKTSELRWPSQQDGSGGFDPLAPDGCF